MDKGYIIQAEGDLKPYFRNLVEQAVLHQDIDVSPIARFYLVNLLNEFAKTDRLYEQREEHFDEVPLAILLLNAIDAEPGERVRSLKRLGDISLYFAGYFSEHIDGKLVDIDYYIAMGEGAYKNLAGCLFGEKVFSELYDELAVKFVSLVNVLSEVRNSGSIMSNTDLLRLYERWIRTGDQWIKERLEKEGITPIKMGSNIAENH